MSKPAAESSTRVRETSMTPRRVAGPACADTRNLLLAMIAMAFVLRMIVAAFLYKEFADPYRGYWHFGWETGRIASSIASGQGFSSPLFGDTGPTAIMTPLYPYLLAGVFKLLGIYSVASAFMILGLNSLFSALTCIPIFFVAETFFTRKIALWSAWAWVFFPYAIYFSAGRIWVTSLAALLLTLGLFATVRLTRSSRPLIWILYGVLWGLNALANPTNVAVLPFLAVWLMYRFRGHGWRWLGSGVLSAVVFLAVISPWFVRNYRTFGRFMPFRDNFWYEFWAGNTGDTSDLVPDWAHPSNGEAEMQKFREQGELRYFDSKKPLAQDFVRRHPATFAYLTAKKIVFTWTGFWSLNPTYLAGEPFEIPNTVFCTVVTVLLLLGLFSTFRVNPAAGVFFALVLVTIPSLYYITHPDLEYRHVIDPEILMLATVAVARFRRDHQGFADPKN
jgi:4-amino-4-deoxy-L-arabinose transferase-like glycosyltransferase